MILDELSMSPHEDCPACGGWGALCAHHLAPIRDCCCPLDVDAVVTCVPCEGTGNVPREGWGQA